MRRMLSFVVLGAALSGVVATSTPAAAYCDPLVSTVTGRCDNLCTLAGRTTRPVWDRAPDEVANPFQYCLA